MKYAAARYVSAGFLSVAICIAIFVCITFKNMQDTATEGKSVSTALQSLRILEAILDDMQNIETSQRGYIISGNKEELKYYFKSIGQVSEDSIRLHSLITDNMLRKDKIERLEQLVREKIAFANTVIKTRDSAGYARAAQLTRSGRGRIIMDSIRAIIFSFETLDRAVLRDSNIKRQQKAKYTTVLFSILSCIFFVVIAFAYFIVRKYLIRQQAYQAELSYLSSLVKQTSETIFSTDPAFLIRSWNKAAERMYGYKTADAIGKSLDDLFTVRIDDEEHGQSLVRLQSEGFYKEEYEVGLKNGGSIHVEASVTVLRNDNGEISGYVAVHKDITDRVKLEGQLRKLNEELEEKVKVKTAELTNIFERITDGFVALDTNWCYTYVNQQAGELVRVDPADMIGKEIWSIFPEAVGHQLHDYYHKALSEQRYYYLEEYYWPLNIWYESRIYPSPNGLSIFFRNITEQKEVAEENRKLAMIASLTINAVVLTDADGYIQWVNKGFERITKYSFNEAFSRKPGEFLQGPDTDAITIDYMSSCMKGKKGFKVELLNYDKEGGKYWLDLEVVPMLDEQNTMTGYMAIIRDITDRKTTEKELVIVNQHLNERAIELVASNTELERFAYMASHDLQEPLRMVTSFLQLLRKNYKQRLDEKAGQYISFAIDGAERMKQLIMDLLEYSRVGTNKEIFVPTDMNKVLTDVKGIFVKFGDENTPEIHSPLLPEIIANKSQMEQLLQNLLSNSIKYKAGAKPVIFIDCKDTGPYFLFSVRDNGIGIDPVYFERIFILFQRLHLKDEYSGTGLGLTICKKIVEKHGGTIWVESAPGKGSTFYFTIKKQLSPQPIL